MSAEKDNYLGNINIKKDGVATEWNPKTIQEYSKCMQDPAYFARTYCKIINLDRGLVNFELYPYQQKMFDHFNSNRFSIVLACRQSGKSISSVAYLLWYAIFHPEKTIVVLANKGSTAREMLGRVTLMLENLPFWLQPGAKSVQKGALEFSNNSRIIAGSTSSSSVRGMSVNLVYLDEFAFVDRAEEFYTSTYPVISSGKDTKVIITSTANGIGNIYHRLWEGAVQGTNNYKPFRVDWWDVPGRDEKWKQETIENTSQLQFDQEFGNTFFGTGDTLIDPQTLLALRALNPKEYHEGGSLKIYDLPVRDGEEKEWHQYLMFVDVSKGLGQDYSTFSIIDVSTRPFKQVAVYRNNKISPLLFPTIIEKWAKIYNEAYVVVESNDQGTLVCNILYNDMEYENMHLESAIKSNKMGIGIDKKTKRIGCSGIKDLVETGKLEVVDKETIQEMTTFVAKGRSYEASEGNHDDIMMTLVLFGYFSNTTAFKDRTDINVKEEMWKQRMKEIEEDVPPFGHIDDGMLEVVQEEAQDHPWAIPYQVNEEVW